MGQIYSGTDFELTLETGVNVTAMATKQILYRKPESTTVGIFSSVSVVGNTRLRCNVTKAVNASTVPAGRWLFHVRLVDGAGKEYLGELATLLIKSRWE